jgi:hypothetical protein
MKLLNLYNSWRSSFIFENFAFDNFLESSIFDSFNVEVSKNKDSMKIIYLSKWFVVKLSMSLKLKFSFLIVWTT